MQILALGAMAAALTLVLAGTVRPSLPPIAAHTSRHFQSWTAAAAGPARPSAPLVRAARHLRVTLGGVGVVAQAGRTRVSLVTLGAAGAGAWTRHAHGVSRPTSFGAETITVAPNRTEILLRVDRHQGTRTWAWRLASSARPRANRDGSISLAGTRLAVAPVRIYDTRGIDVTPRSARWSLARVSRSWQISLRLNDARLPSRYVIDPVVSYRPEVAADGPSHQWKLDDSGASAVDSVDGATGAYEGSPAKGQPSLALGAGTSVLFHGNPDDVSLGPIESPTTIEAWVKFTSGAEMPIFSNAQPGGGDPGAMYFGFESGHLFAYTHGGPFWESTMGLNDGATHYVAFVNDGGTGQLYVDGRPDGAPHGGIPAPAAPTAAYIAHDLSNGGGEYWNGTLDEVATYTTALSAARIREHYLAGVDNTAPVISFSTGPADNSATNQTTATFTFATDDGSPMTCHLDGAADAACTSPQTFTGLAEATHTFTVSSVDEAGNSSSRTIHWTVDTTAPTGTFDSPAAGLYKDPVPVSVTANDTGSGVASVHLLDGAADVLALAGSGSTWTGNWTGGSDGGHSLSAVITDRAGNTFQTAVTAITLDNTGPAVTITSAPNDPTSSTVASFSFTATDAHPPSGGFSYQCSLDAAGTSCTGPHTLAEGAHTFTVQTTDSLGNVGAKSYTWHVDTTKPVTTITSGPADPTKLTSASFSFAAADASSVTYECKLDASSFGPCPGSYTGLGEGTHTFTVAATDAAGNVESPGATYTWHVDLTAPGLGFTGGPTDGAGTNQPSSTFTFAVTDASGYTTACQLDGGSAGPCTTTSSYTTPALAQGSHTLTVTATDAALNSTTKTVSWMVDTTAPDGTIVSPTSGNTVSSPIEFDVSASDNVGVTNVAVLEGGVTRATLHLASGSPAAGLWMGTWSTGANGTHTLSIVVTDVGGNTRQVPVVVTIGLAVAAPIDLSAPSAPTDFAGNVHPDGLLLYWGPATDQGTGVAHYFLWINGRIVQAFGPTEFQAGPFADFSSTDTRVFQLDANDYADNLGPFAPALTGVPVLAGRTLDEARAALLARGFAVGAVTEEAAAAQPGTVIGQSPASPGVAPVGSAVDLVVSKQGGQATLVMDVAVAHRILLNQRRFIAVRVELSLASTVTSTLYDPRGRKLASWRRDGVQAGATIIQLRLPKTIRRTGVYRLVVRADGGGQTARRTLEIRLVGKATAKVRPIAKSRRRAAEIVLVNGPDIHRDLLLKLNHSLRVLYVTGTKVFGVASAPSSNVGVAVVDLDESSPDLVRELRLVFPDLRVIAIVSSPAQAAAARSAGASVVFTKPVSAGVLAVAIRALLG